MLALNWPLVLFTTVGLYVLIILTLPFNAIYATIFLFTLIAFWSRMPGVGMPHPFYILYNADVVDIFTLIIAINLGPMQAVVFSLFCNYVSRMCGVYPDWAGVIQDSIYMSLFALIAPLLSMMVGGNLIMVILVYTVVRPIYFFLMNFLWPRSSIIERLITSIGAGFCVFIINAFYAKMFGDFFEGLLQKGVAFSWILFLFASIVILIFATAVFGFSPKKTGKSLGKKVVKIAKRGIKKEHGSSQEHDHEVDEMRRIKESL